MPDLYHFTRTPPGLRCAHELEPRSHDISKHYTTQLDSLAREFYNNRSFIFTIPADMLDAWKETGQLHSLLDMIVSMDWFNRSVEQWRIATANLDLTDALIRETYFFSPKALGIKSDLRLTLTQKKTYDAAYLKMLNSVVPYSHYKGNFINPEILLPFPVPLSIMTLECIID